MRTRPPQTAVQVICREYGQDLWATNNLWSLRRLLIAQGELDEVAWLDRLVEKARDNALKKYIDRRKALDPSWELPADLEGTEDVY